MTHIPSKIEERIALIRETLARHGVSLEERILFSFDPEVRLLLRDLSLDEIDPRPGQRRSLIPIPMDSPMYAVIQRVESYHEFHWHSHDDAHVFHFVMSGHAIFLAEERLDPLGNLRPFRVAAGHGIWVPKEKRYMFWTEEEPCVKIYFHLQPWLEK